MEIKKELKDNVLTIALEGRLDSNTAPLLDNELTTLEGVERLTLDFAKLEYISSAGLRVLVLAQKQMYRYGKKMILRNVSAEIMDIFEVTGLADALIIE